MILLLLMGAQNAVAQNHLEPDVSSLAMDRPQKYERVLDELFVLEGDSEFVVRTLARPSWGPEWVSGIRCVDSVAEVFVSMAEESVYHAGSRSGSGWHPDLGLAVQTKQRSRVIDSYTAGLVYLAWRNAILDTRYPDRAMMHLDGVRYLFSAFVDGRGILSGQTHSPEPESLPGQLVNLTNALERFTRSDDPDSGEIAEIARQVVLEEYEAELG
jgi:hypothetical protein